MLEDRDYMRGSGVRGSLSATAKLTILMVVVFALQCINDFYLQTPVESWLQLTRRGLLHGWLWQLVTFQLLHADLLHIILNLIMFWWLGHFCENVLGRTRFVIALFACGAVGGLLQGLLMIAFPMQFGGPGGSVVGASAGVSGLLAIFCLLERDTPIRFNFILPMRAVVMLYIFGGISLFFTLVPTPRVGGVAHAAHLGGILAGVAWVKLGWHRDFARIPGASFLEKWRGIRSASVRRRQEKSAGWTPQIVNPGEPGDTDFVSREVDPILEKISAKGIHSLTQHEKEILEAARSKMKKR